MATLLRFAARSVLVALVLAGSSRLGWAQSRFADFVPQTMAEQHGLTSAWVTVVNIDPARDRIENIVLSSGLLIVQSKAGLVHVLDAETGRTLWSTRVGNPRYVTVPAVANESLVVVANGTTLYMYNRQDGTLSSQQEMGGPPSAGLAMTAGHIYAPLNNGAMEAYSLDRSTAMKRAPTIYFAAGAATAAPLVTDKRLMWGTLNDFVYVDDLVASRNRVRFKAGAAVVGSLDFKAPLVYAASKDGFLYALNEASGDIAWQYYLGAPGRQAPVVSGNSVYAISDDGLLTKVDAATGAPRWSVPAVRQFVSASPSRVYVSDIVGRLMILDAATGATLAALPTESITLKFMNSHNDRLYVGTATGVLQCLHERELVQPVVRGEGGPTTPSAAPTTPAAPGTPATPGVPATPAPATPGAPPADNPFGNPFG